MVRKIPSKKYPAGKYLDFIRVAKSFNDAAELAIEHEYYNAGGVLIIHSAIAYADAITIIFASTKTSGDSHYDVIGLLKNSIPPQYKSISALDHFKKMIDHKNMVSYSGDVYDEADINKLNKHFLRFLNWAKDILEN